MNEKIKIVQRLFQVIFASMLLISFHTGNAVAQTATPTPTSQTNAGALTCFSGTSVFNCVQIDPYTVRWNVVGNPYDNGNITGSLQFKTLVVWYM